MRILKHSPDSQCVPVKPATQRHVYELTASEHVASFLQGLLAHSSISKTSSFERVGQRGGGRDTIMEVEMNTLRGEGELFKCPHICSNRTITFTDHGLPRHTMSTKVQWYWLCQSPRQHRYHWLTCLAELSRVTGDTETRVRVDSVSARSFISTRTAGAFVDI